MKITSGLFTLLKINSTYLSILLASVFFYSCSDGNKVQKEQDLSEFKVKKNQLQNELNTLELELKFANEKLTRAKELRIIDRINPNRRESRIREAEEGVVICESKLDALKSEIESITDSIDKIEDQIR